jgi:hypothetical protein
LGIRCYINGWKDWSLVNKFVTGKIKIMRSPTITCLLIQLLILSGAGAQPDPFVDTATAYFKELKQATRENKSIWGIDIYGPLLLVDPSSRRIYANFPDSASVLKKHDSIYTGILPLQVNISNTAIKWSGQNWAMVMLPLSRNYHNRLNLLSHELFHRVQASLGFFAYNPANNHLDKKEGRISLRLELEALRKAIGAFALPGSRLY